MVSATMDCAPKVGGGGTRGSPTSRHLGSGSDNRVVAVVDGGAEVLNQAAAPANTRRQCLASSSRSGSCRKTPSRGWRSSGRSRRRRNASRQRWNRRRRANCRTRSSANRCCAGPPRHLSRLCRSNSVLSSIATVNSRCTSTPIVSIVSRHALRIVRPPSTGRATPVMKADAGSTRLKVPWATSSGSA